MQYILSQEEYTELLNKISKRSKEEEDILQDLCTKVCDNMPIVWDWGRNEDKLMQPWGCILTKKNWYCDQCPVSKVCPRKWKEWSK